MSHEFCSFQTILHLKKCFPHWCHFFVCDSVDPHLTFFINQPAALKKKKVFLRDHPTMTNVHSCCGHLMQIKWVDNIIQILLTRAWGKGKMILCLSIWLHLVLKVMLLFDNLIYDYLGLP